MAFNKSQYYGESMNILDSEVGLVTKTREAVKSMAESDGVIKAGALWKVEDGGTVKELGIVLEDYDMDDYEKKPIAVVFQGRIREDRVPEATAAKKADFAKQGLYLV